MNFKKTFHLNYASLISQYNAQFGTSYDTRQVTHIVNRFKKMSRLVIKYIGAVTAAGDPPSGDTERDLFHQKSERSFYR